MDAKEKLQRERTAGALERWYAERGSRVFTGVWRFPPVPDPVAVCSHGDCQQPAKIAAGGWLRCADHWLAAIG